MQNDIEPRTVRGCPALSKLLHPLAERMLATSRRLTPNDFYSGEDALAYVDSEFELPTTLTSEALDAINAERSMPLDAVIALMTGLPHNEDAPMGTLKRWHAAVWLFKQAAKAPRSVASGTRDHKEMEDIRPIDFLIPRCLGSKDSSIRTDTARVDDNTFFAPGPQTSWYDVRFDTLWLDGTLRALKPQRGKKQPTYAPEPAVRREMQRFVDSWGDRPRPNQDVFKEALEKNLGLPIRREVFREANKDIAPHWKYRGRTRKKQKSARK